MIDPVRVRQVEPAERRGLQADGIAEVPFSVVEEFESNQDAGECIEKIAGQADFAYRSGNGVPGRAWLSGSLWRATMRGYSRQRHFGAPQPVSLRIAPDAMGSSRRRAKNSALLSLSVKESDSSARHSSSHTRTVAACFSRDPPNAPPPVQPRHADEKE